MSRRAAGTLAVALLAAARCGDNPTQPPTPSDEIRVTTNKTQYSPQEPILVAATNAGKAPAWLWLNDCLPHFEMQTPAGWVPEYIPVCPAGWSYHKLAPGANRESVWMTLPPGEYRVLVYSFDSEGCATQDLCDMIPPREHRSAPFTIR
jgi:hypothetical protein